MTLQSLRLDIADTLETLAVARWVAGGWVTGDDESDRLHRGADTLRHVEEWEEIRERADVEELEERLEQFREFAAGVAALAEAAPDDKLREQLTALVGEHWELTA